MEVSIYYSEKNDGMIHRFSHKHMIQVFGVSVLRYIVESVYCHIMNLLYLTVLAVCGIAWHTPKIDQVLFFN